MPPLSRPPMLPPPSPPSAAPKQIASLPPKPSLMSTRKDSGRSSSRSPRSSPRISPASHRFKKTYSSSRFEGLAALENSLQETIQKHGSNHSKVASLYTQIGNVHFRQGDLRQAKDSYQSAICCEIGSHTATAYLNLGTVYWSMGDMEKAIQVLQQALAYNELDILADGSPTLNNSLFAASVHHQLGLCYALQNDYGNAMSCLQKAYDIRDQSKAPVEAGKTLVALAKIMSLNGELQQAVDYHEQAYKLLATHQSLTASNLEGLAKAYEDIEEYGKAVYVYKELVTIQQQDPSLSEATNKSLQKLKDLEAYNHQRKEAEKFIEEASMKTLQV